MQVGILYIVTHDSDNKKFQIGDRIWMLDSGDIIHSTKEGWAQVEDISETACGMEFNIDAEWFEKKHNYYKTMLENLDGAMQSENKL
jgi:hypothetical protein